MNSHCALAPIRNPLYCAAVILLLVLAGCSGSREQLDAPVVPAGPEAGQAAGAPGGVSPAVWHQLNAELERVLAQYGTARRTSAAASGKGSIVPDLGLHVSGGQTVYTWSYRQHGDYDLNGIVSAADLVSVGINFGKSTLSSDWQKAQLADGDGNGQITIADVAAIGQNFGGRIDGYELQFRDDSAQPFTLKAELALLPANPQSGQYPQYSHTGPLSLLGPEYRVIPFTDAGGPRAYGVPSVIFDTKAGLNTRWYTPRGNQSRDGRAGNNGPLAVGGDWELELNATSLSAYYAEPVVDQYGTIYFGLAANETLDHPVPGSLYAVTADGKLKWTFRTVDGIAMGAATNRLGRVVIGDLSGIVYCLAPDGKQVWRKQLSGMCLSVGPLLFDSGEVYLLTQVFSGGGFAGSTLYKLEADGSVAWSRGLNQTCLSSPFYSSAGEICVLDYDGEFYSFDADGNTVQNYMLPSAPSSLNLSAGAACRDQVYAYAENATAYRINALDNSIGVSTSLGIEIPRTMPAINNSGRFIIGTQEGGTQALKLNYYLSGLQEWELIVSGDFISNIAIDKADNMYFGTFLTAGGSQVPNGISCVRSDQSTLWFYPTADYIPLFTVLAAENQLVCLAQQDADEGRLKLIGISGN